jgi:hypothetical protein
MEAVWMESFEGSSSVRIELAGWATISTRNKNARNEQRNMSP